jgi:hypothetical protein
MRFLVQTRLGTEEEESYFTVAAPDDPRVAVAIAKSLRVADPLDPAGEALRTAIVIDEESEEEFFDGVARADWQLNQVDQTLRDTLLTIGQSGEAAVTHEEMRQIIDDYSWEAAGLGSG